MTAGHGPMLYLTATGPADPTRASLAFHLAANGAAAAGYAPEIVLLGDAADLVKAGVADGVRGVCIPPLGELLVKAGDLGIPLHA